MASRGNHLSTGFLGTPFLLNVLQDGGRADLAYKLLVQDSYPSWGYMLSRGGTTIWERWDGIRPDGSLQDAGMNSFNHYGLGSIGDWLYDEVGGLAPPDAGLQEAARPALHRVRAEQRLLRRQDEPTARRRPPGRRTPRAA